MPITANYTDRKSWLTIEKDSDFPIQNIPFGVFLTKENIITVGTRLGNYAIDLGALQQLGYFEGIELTDDVFLQDTLNDFISDGKKTWRLVRNRIADIFDANNPTLKNNEKHKAVVVFNIEDVEMQLPVFIGDYTDFFSSREHATNTGKIFRGTDNPLLNNWLHLPVAYHGRSSTIIPSGIPVHRPMGQTLAENQTQPEFGACKNIDFELEMAFITTDANIMGESIAVQDAEEYIFGMVLLNDWSARDMQKWESAPLGPFLSKNFATSISPWIVTMDALEPFRCPSVVQDNPKPLPYLQQSGNKSFDICLEVGITPNNGTENIISKTNCKHLYWTIAQQLAHHTSNGCRVNSGDMMGSGTISGPTPDSYGSMLELTWAGENPITLNNGEQRKFINDNDTVTMRGYCQNNAVRIGFGTLTSKLLPPFERK